MEPPQLSLTLFYIAFSFLLVLLNAFFVAAEFAIVKVRRTRLLELADQGVSAARISILCVDQLDEYLSTTQLGITLVSLALGWVGEESFFNLFVILAPEAISANTGVFHAVAGGLSFFIITMLHVVLGELVPKSMAIQRAEEITLVISKPLRLFYKIAKPLILIFTVFANFILRRIGYHNSQEVPLTEEELKLVMKESKEDGVISESEAQIIHRAFEFSDKRARDIMISASKVQYLSLERDFNENITVSKQNMYTRFPLTSNGLNSVLGVVHMKDVLHHKGEVDSNEVFRKSMRPAVFIDASTRQDKIMKILNERRTQMAIVQDSKTKQNIGIVTMEDILEELVGEIFDEHGN